MGTQINQIQGRSPLCNNSQIHLLSLLAEGYLCMGAEAILTCRLYEVNELYNFETWGRQLSAFIADVVKEPAFLICNSVGGRDLA